MRLALLCLLTLLLTGRPAFGQGTVTVSYSFLGPSGEAVAFVPVLVRSERRQQSLITDYFGTGTHVWSKQAKLTITIEDIAFKPMNQRIQLGDRDTHIVITLQPRNPNEWKYFDSVDESDPAIRAIKGAIRQRAWNAGRHYHLKMKAVKTVQIKVDTARSNFPRIWVFETVPDSNRLGLQFLSQAVSTFERKAGTAQFKEEVNDYREAGDWEYWQFPDIARLIHGFSLYDSESRPFDLHDALFVSPVGWGAFQVYRFKLLRRFYRNGVRQYQISVTPLNEFGQAWRGTITLAEGSWALTEVDLGISKNTGLVSVDSLRFTQTYTRFPGDFWWPDKTELLVWKRFYGTDIQYSVNSKFQNHAFQEDSSVSYGLRQYNLPVRAWNFDDSFWAEHVETLPDEAELFCKRDSLKHYQEQQQEMLRLGIRQKPERFEWYHVILGRTYRNPGTGTEFYFDGILNDKMGFNTVEGFTLAQSAKFRKQVNHHRNWEAEGLLRYGFSDSRWKFRLNWEYKDAKMQRHIEASAGSMLAQINNSEPIQPIINTFYTLFLQQNFMKLYRKHFVKASMKQELINGLYAEAGFELALRSTVENRSDFTFFPLAGGFTPNNPNHTSEDYVLRNNRRLFLHGGLSFKPGQRYQMVFDEKKIRPSAFPMFSVFLSGVPGSFISDVSFSLLEFSISQDIPIRWVGTTSYIVKSGTYLHRNAMTYLDYTHFMGEQTYFLGSSVNGTYLDQFRALGYYTYSTNHSFIELHAQHSFGQFPLHLIPLMRQLKWRTHLGLNGLFIFDSNQTNYWELYFGFDNLFASIKPLEMFNLRMDAAVQLLDGFEFSPSFLVGLGLRFGERP